MNKETKNQLKVNLTDRCSWHALVLGGVDDIMAAGNSEKLANAMHDSVVIVADDWRVYGAINTHMAQRLEAAGVDGWRVDGIGKKGVQRYSVYTEGAWQCREYVVDINTWEAAPVLAKNEAICKECGAIVLKTKIVGCYCLKCLRANNKRHGFAYRYGYHEFNGEYKVFEKIDTTKEPVFGVEIERDYLGGYSSDFSKDLDAATFGAVKALYNLKKKQERRSVFMYDGSLTYGGVEWITYPQTLKGYTKERKQYAAALEIFKKYNFTNTTRAGNHIHINRDFFGDADSARFAAAKMALILAENWAQFCAIVGRDIHNTDYTQKPHHQKNDSIFTLAEKTINSEHAHSVAVNLQHSATIELRLFGGIDSVDDLHLYIDIARALAFFVKKKGLETCQRASVVDMCKYINMKAEHLPEIAARLKAKEFEQEAAEVLKLLDTKEAKA